VHFVGKYCAKKWPIKGCKTWKNTYCVFDSKMARIIQEEGVLKQLNPNAFGTAKNPTCAGITVGQLQQLDLERVDFVKPVYPYRDGRPLAKAGIADDIDTATPSGQATADAINARIQQKARGK
jgi:conjugal transfer mating pair stabilization protein TraN